MAAEHFTHEFGTSAKANEEAFKKFDTNDDKFLDKEVVKKILMRPGGGRSRGAHLSVLAHLSRRRRASGRARTLKACWHKACWHTSPPCWHTPCQHGDEVCQHAACSTPRPCWHTSSPPGRG